jgi:hypothetical protein
MRAAAACLLAGLALASPVRAAQFNWDGLGAEFCRLSVAGDVAGLRAIFTQSLNRALDAAMANPALMPPNVLFQSYTNVVPACRAKTRNAALVEIDRGNPPRGVPSWTEYLVIAPEADGSTRIDDVLFATRRSDTLKARLTYYALAR